MPLVTVVIPTFNRSAVLGRAVSSVFAQTCDAFELLVVDDGSTDSTPEVLRPFQSRLRVIRHERNRGVSAARNTGIRESDSPLLAFLDSDDVWLPEKLARQLALMDASDTPLISQTDEIWIRNGRRVNPGVKHLKPAGDIFIPSLKRCLVSPSAVIIRRRLFEEVGLFDTSLPACEDYDLWLRVSCRHPVHLLPQKLVIRHGGHTDQLSARYKGMDRYRIAALVKILKGHILSLGQATAAMQELVCKCRVYATGCRRRGRVLEAAFYWNLPRALARTSAAFRGGVEMEATADLPLLGARKDLSRR